MEFEEPKTMKEIREIRDKMYQDIKNMTPTERRDYFRRKAKQTEEKLHTKLPRITKIKT